MELLEAFFTRITSYNVCYTKLLRGQRWANVDVELECGSGVVPFEYSMKNKVHSVQWAMGLDVITSYSIHYTKLYELVNYP